MEKANVGYWDKRLAEPIRYLLHFKGVSFEDKGYTFDSLDALAKMYLDLPNRPYRITDEVRLTYSTTILQYLARKHHLYGRTPKERLCVLVAEGKIFDFRTALFRLICNENFENLLPEFLEKVPKQLKFIDEIVGCRKYLAGENITYVDFVAYDTIDVYRYVNCKVLDDFPSLKAYQERIENLPELQEYLHSSTCKRWFVGSPFATFGGKGPESKRE